MTDVRDELVRLDVTLGRTWAKAEILLGLLFAGTGMFLGFWQLGRPQLEASLNLSLAGLGLFVFGGYLAMAGHRSHLYRWNNRNTVTMIDEIRSLSRLISSPESK
jgi:hypothetical protein